MLVTLLVAAFSVHPVLSTPPDDGMGVDVEQITQSDLDGDGIPDVTIIEGSFTTSRDTVTVYDGGRDMVRSQDWRQATDFTNDIWLFDAASDGSVELVIDFHQSNEGLVAELWDDQDGDGSVIVGEFPELVVRESQWPTVRVVVPDGWWMQDELINYNLMITVDGPIRALHQAHLLRHLKTDGVPDFLMQVRDLDYDGRPDLHWIDVWPDGPAGWGYQRTLLMVNPTDDEPPIEGSIFWPYLGSATSVEGPHGERTPSFELTKKPDSQGFTKHYGVSHPPIQVAWAQASVAYVGEFVASRFNDRNWFVYSNERATPGEVSLSNFEAPFAFYDLAQDDDGYPELAIRFQQYRIGNTFDQNRHTLVDPIQIVRYTWDQDNNGSWDYKIGAVGRHSITETASVPELNLALSMPEPDHLPGWIAERDWDGMTFVAAEYDRLRTSEGIYNWGISEEWFMEYITGRSDAPPSSDYEELPVRLRGEVAFDQQRQVMLYLSPIDRKWHLVGADRGQWRFDDTGTILYDNLGGDYVNKWTRLEREQEQEAIYHLPDYVIHHDVASGSVRFFRVDLPPSQAVATPPTNHDEWQAFAELAPLEQGSGHDLATLVSDLGTPETTLSGADIRDLRVVADDFRFIIELKPDYTLEGRNSLARTDLPAGTYLVRYDGEFRTSSVKAPSIVIDIRDADEGEGSTVPAKTLRMELRNEGDADLVPAWLVVTAEKDGEHLTIARRDIALPARTRERLQLRWQPSSNGEWLISAMVEDAKGEVIATAPHAAIYAASSGSQILPLLSLTTGNGWHASALVVLVGLSVLLVFLIRRLWAEGT